MNKPYVFRRGHAWQLLRGGIPCAVFIFLNNATDYLNKLVLQDSQANRPQAFYQLIEVILEEDRLSVLEDLPDESNKANSA